MKGREVPESGLRLRARDAARSFLGKFATDLDARQVDFVFTPNAAWPLTPRGLTYCIPECQLPGVPLP